jgi:hypothetical protein
VLACLAEAHDRKKELLAIQGPAFQRAELRFRTDLRERLYARAGEGLADEARSDRLLEEIASRYRTLALIAERVADLVPRFATNVRKQKKVTIARLGDVAGAQIEPAPGDDKDLFIVRNGKNQTFRLADLPREDLEKILAFGEDPLLKGYFYAAEAYREELEDPTKAEALRVAARQAFTADDPWMDEVVAALNDTQERIREGEKRANKAHEELLAARSTDPTRALMLCNELLSTLKWTATAKKHSKDYEDIRKELARLHGGELVRRKAGVPPGQLRQRADGWAEIAFTGRKWYPGTLPDNTPDREQRLEKAADAHWQDWFRAEGKKDDELARLVQRAKTQLLPWSENTETGPEGGYRLPPVVIVPRAGWRVEPVALDFPFRADRDWSVELELRCPGREPGYFAFGVGQILAVVGYHEARGIDGRPCIGGGMAGACLLEAEAMDPAALEKPLGDLRWHLVKQALAKGRPKSGDKTYLDAANFPDGVPCRMHLERKANLVRFEMWPATMPDRKVTLEKAFRDGRALERLAALPDGTRIRFYGAPPPGPEPATRRHELHEVTIAGFLPEPPRGGADAQ